MKRLVICLFIVLGPMYTFAQLKPLKALADSYNGEYTLSTTDTATKYEFKEAKESPVTLISLKKHIIKALYNGRTIYFDSWFVIPTKQSKAWLDAANRQQDHADYVKHTKLYGKRIADAANKGELVIGMPVTLVTGIKGTPDDVRTVTTAAGKTVIATYTKYVSTPLVLTFHNGKLSQIDQ